MIATVVQNAMGHLHVWQGVVDPVPMGRYNYHADGREAELYLQGQADIEAVRRQMAAEDWEVIGHGWPAVVDLADDLCYGGSDCEGGS